MSDKDANGSSTLPYTLGDGRPGPVTLRLRDAYWALHEDPGFSFSVRYD
jgi:hypothetical protein